MKLVGQLTVTIIVLILSTILGGYIFSLFWGWFIVPVFLVSPLSIAQAIGISFIVRYTTKDFSEKKNEVEERRDFNIILYTEVIRTVVMTGFLFLGGWIIHLFI